ncbi:hypothetical protein [Blastococcus sp. SYSU D00813]
MSRRPDGTYKCDRSGHDVGNAAVTECAIVSTLVLDADGNQQLEVLHFCRIPNPGAPEGCAEHLLVPSNLADYLASKETSG